MIFELLRTYKVDVLRYLPKFLAHDPTFKASQDALSEEHEKLRLLIIDMCKQMFVESATWGLDDWERVYGIKTDLDATLEQRRETLLAKIQGIQTITAKKLERFINIVVPTKDAHVIENIGPNQFKIGLDTIIAVEEVRRVVEVYKPAHLTYAVAHAFWGECDIYVSGAVSVINKQFISYAKDDKQITSRGNIVIGGAVAVTDYIKYGGKV